MENLIAIILALLATLSVSTESKDTETKNSKEQYKVTEYVDIDQSKPTRQRHPKFYECVDLDIDTDTDTAKTSRRKRHTKFVQTVDFDIDQGAAELGNLPKESGGNDKPQEP